MNQPHPTASLLVNTHDPLRLIYSQTRGTTTSAGFEAVYERPQLFMPKKIKESMADEMNHPGRPPGDSALEVDAIQTREMIRLVDDALTAGHLSVTRGVHFTFAFSVARSTGRQMLRHVVGVAWEEMSQRYVKLLNPQYLSAFKLQTHAAFDENDYTPEERRVAWQTLLELAGQVFVVPEHIEALGQESSVAHDWFWLRSQEIEQYLEELAAGVAMEDARENLPNCTRTEMIGTWSFEALKTFLGKRLCTRAQAPIREVAKAMRKQVVGEYPWMARHLTIHCLPMGICPESRPDGCALLLENGGTVLRQGQARTALRDFVNASKTQAKAGVGCA